jgi:chitinase
MISDTTDFETTTLETVSESPGLPTTISPITEIPDLETNTDAFSDKPELQAKSLNTNIESRGLESIIERSPFKLFCGFGSWAAHRQGEGKFGAQDLNSISFVLQRCTHIIYAFAGLNSSGQVVSLDPNLELDPLSGTFAQLREIKQSHPHIKILIAMGGWDIPSNLFSFLVSDEGTRKSLLRNIPNFAKQHGFDGAIISWFHPGSHWRGGHPLDKQNLATFLQVLKLKVQFYI